MTRFVLEIHSLHFGKICFSFLVEHSPPRNISMSAQANDTVLDAAMEVESLLPNLTTSSIRRRSVDLEE